MKIIYLKRSFFYFLLILILSIIISIFATYQIAKNKYEEALNFDDEPEHIEEQDVAKTREEFLINKYKEKKILALTFDDGPSEYTEELVDNLKKRNVPVTFFVLGVSIENRKDTLKFAYDSGNEIAIHSYAHKVFTQLKDLEIEEQINKTRQLIIDTINVNPTLIRVPYGSHNSRIDKVLEKAELTSVLWNVDSLDWKFKNVDKTYSYVLKKFKPNSIILMHDTFKTSIDAAIKIVDKLQGENYTFVTVSEFLKIQQLAKKT